MLLLAEIRRQLNPDAAFLWSWLSLSENVRTSANTLAGSHPPPPSEDISVRSESTSKERKDILYSWCTCTQYSIV